MKKIEMGRKEERKNTNGKNSNRKNGSRRTIAGIAACSILVATVLSGCSNTQNSINPEVPDGVKAVFEKQAAAQYPEEPVFKDDDARWDYSREKRQKLTETFAAAYDAFAVETTAEILKNSSENMVYSPLSLYYALALAASGAEGTTKEEMLELLGYETLESLTADCKSSFEALYHVTNEENNKPNEWGEYDSESRYMLTIANSLWADDALDMKESFAKSGAENFYADIFTGDLQSQKVADAKADWVKERTNGLIEPNAEPADTAAVLSIINTIYFYDEWINRFNKENTKEDTFTCEDGTEVTCDFMNMKMGSHGFRRGETFTESSLSLKNGTMTFYLPNEGVSVYELVQDVETFNQVLNGEREYISGKVIWQVPKFSYGSDLSLADMLKTLGMEEAFLESADFGGITDQSPVFISNVKQNAHLGIDEDGVEGAAFTEIMYAGAALPRDEAEMILDRPFLYTVKNNGRIIFIGICENPAES